VSEINMVADRLELRRLVDLYAKAVDTRDSEAYVALFLPTGQFVMQRSDGDVVWDGPTQIIQNAVTFSEPAPFARTFHFVANHLCEITGDTGTGETYCLAHHLALDGARMLVTHMIYRDEYARTDDGWKFARRTTEGLWKEWRPTSELSAREVRWHRGTSWGVWTQQPEFRDQPGAD
jgi:hypothetical protein